ncbi:uncharacterized protein LOC131169374 [Hevea brasiliensis]|uniref:uncharacterized protein LOC131169374 n=1 Tax=Hevea brasiliensis TaxID=3981 RepID=UPI0025DC8902|nr:uncharacterized protein LOC131169374 [Hevea brasiliensis]
MATEWVQAGIGGSNSVFRKLELNYKELKFVFPSAERINRGGRVISEIIESCCTHDYTDIILFQEHHGVPDGLIISHLPFGPTAYFGLLNVVGSLSQSLRDTSIYEVEKNGSERNPN